MDQKSLIDAFHSMWDKFPEPVRLIRKDRTVLAVNKAAEEDGLVVGTRCIDTPPKELHAGCQADLALKAGCARHNLSINGSRMRFWIPVEGYEEVFVHFSILSPTVEQNSGV